ncbi:MAG: hypothetical protein V1839_00670 [archaeon]
MTKIYSGISAEVLTDESGDKQVYIYDENGGKYSPNLILPNPLAAKKMRDFLDKFIRRFPAYFERAGEPLEKKLE